MGFREGLGVAHFYEVPELPRRNGAKVYVAAVSEVNASSVRGEQLLQQMKPWASRDGIAPELLASVTTMACGIGEMNHIFGLIGKGAPSPAQFYLTHAARLKLAGV